MFSRKHNQKREKSIWLPWIMLFLSMIILLYVWRIITIPEPKPQSALRPAAVVQQPSPPTRPQITGDELKRFFNQEVSPEIDNYTARNQQAVERAINRISSEFSVYKNRIPDFVEDITSWSTRFGVMGRGVKDLWKKCWKDNANSDQVSQYAYAKFERDMFSENNLTALLQSTLNQLKDDLKASQNQLHADVTASWDSKDYGLGELDIQKITDQVDQDIKLSSNKFETESVEIGILSFVAGWAAQDATVALIKIILDSLTSDVAASVLATTATGSSMLTFTVVGGESGAGTCGPIGSILGAVAGFGAGAAADWWMTKKFKEKLTGDLNDLLTRVETGIVTGSKGSPGLKEAFQVSILTMENAERMAIYDSLMETIK